MDNLEKWCQQWDSVLNQGGFGTQVTASEEDANELTDTSLESEDLQLVTENKSGDACNGYWNNYLAMVQKYGPDSKQVRSYPFFEEVKVDLKKYAKTMATNPNPIRPSTIGQDQDIGDPVVAGATYLPSDLKNLEGLKVKLHDLLSKLNSMETKSQTGTAQVESQIDALKKQIDELSDSLTRTGVPSQLGD